MTFGTCGYCGQVVNLDYNMQKTKTRSKGVVT